ncbi:MAG: MFS transporter [Acidobacteria bacterium]|nr:MAG: MFS transporter [Acidobacteriota bacterium]
MDTYGTQQTPTVRFRRQLAELVLLRRGEKSLPRLNALRFPAAGSLRSFWYDGLLTSISDSLSSNFIPLFALKMGATASQIGVLNATAGFVGTMMLLPGARLGERWSSRKSFVVLTFSLARLTLLVLALIPFGVAPTTAVGLIIVFNLLRVVFGNLGLPAWTSLSASVVPENVRGRYFASRNGIMTIASIIFAPLAGYLIVSLKGEVGYQLTFFLAFVAGAAAVWFYRQIDEPPAVEAPVVRGKRFPLLHRILQRPYFVRLCVYSIFWHFALNLAVPFFNIYLVEETTGDEASVGYLAAIGSVIGLVSQQYWGQVNDRLGARRTLLITGVVIPFITFGWLFVRSPWHVVPINLASGLVWPGFNLATFTLVLEATPEERRPRYVALLNTLTGIGSAVGATVGGWMIEAYGYHSVFLASGLLRIVGWFLLLFFVKEAATNVFGRTSKLASPQEP